MKHTVTIMNGGSPAAGFVHGWRAYPKKDGWLRRAAGAVLIVQLCLAVFPARADSAKPATAEKRATVAVHSVPEGYRPLPVTKFVVEAEKDTRYIISVAVEYSGEPKNISKWFEENINGEIEFYRVKDNALIFTNSVFYKGNGHFHFAFFNFYLNRDFEGEIFSVHLDKGKYIISPHLFFKGEASGYVPLAYVSFHRSRLPETDFNWIELWDSLTDSILN